MRAAVVMREEWGWGGWMAFCSSNEISEFFIDECMRGLPSYIACHLTGRTRSSISPMVHVPWGFHVSRVDVCAICRQA